MRLRNKGCRGIRISPSPGFIRWKWTSRGFDLRWGLQKSSNLIFPCKETGTYSFAGKFEYHSYFVLILFRGLSPVSRYNNLVKKPDVAKYMYDFRSAPPRVTCQLCAHAFIVSLAPHRRKWEKYGIAKPTSSTRYNSRKWSLKTIPFLLYLYDLLHFALLIFQRLFIAYLWTKLCVSAV